MLFIVLVEGYFIPDIKQDKNKRCQANRKPQDVEKSVELVSQQVTECGNEEVF
jgi:hypothetical protein